MFTFSFDETKHSAKPDGMEAGRISKRIRTVTMNHKQLANALGNDGCSFTPGVFEQGRRKEYFIEQQLIALDFDDGVIYSEIRDRCHKYGLPILFSYRSFSWKPEHEKFRVVFALEDPIKDVFTIESIILILMEIFPECDKACKDCARLFYGSNKGIIEVSDVECTFDFPQLIIAFEKYLKDKYGKDHYTSHIKAFYNENNISTTNKGRTPEVCAVGKTSALAILYNKADVDVLPKSKSEKNEYLTGEHNLTRDFDFDELYNRCKHIRACIHR